MSNYEQIQFFDSNVFSSNINTISLKLFRNHGGIYRFEKKSKKHSGRINLLGVHRNIRGCILEVNSEGLGARVVTDDLFVYHFIDSDLRVEIFSEKGGAAENGG